VGEITAVVVELWAKTDIELALSIELIKLEELMLATELALFTLPSDMMELAERLDACSNIDWLDILDEASWVATCMEDTKLAKLLLDKRERERVTAELCEFWLICDWLEMTWLSPDSDEAIPALLAELMDSWVKLDRAALPEELLEDPGSAVFRAFCELCEFQEFCEIEDIDRTLFWELCEIPDWTETLDQ
jgi:hypothetical protein